MCSMPFSAEIITTGISSIWRLLFIAVSTSKPFISGMTISSRIRSISVCVRSSSIARAPVFRLDKIVFVTQNIG